MIRIPEVPSQGHLLVGGFGIEPNSYALQAYAEITRLAHNPLYFGGVKEARTPDIRNAIALFSQLNYNPNYSTRLTGLAL